VAISPDGTRALSAGHDRTVRLLDLTRVAAAVPPGPQAKGTSRVLAEKVGTQRGWIFGAAITPDGKRGAAGGINRVAVWDLDSGQEIRRFEKGGAFTCVALSKDGHQVLAGTEEKVAYLWDVDTGKELQRFEGHQTRVTCVALSPDGRLVVTGSGRQKIVDGKVVFVGGKLVYEDCLVRVWEPTTGKLSNFQWPTTEPVQALSFTADGRRLLFADKIAWHSVDLETKTSTISGWAQPGVSAVAFSGDGKRAVVGTVRGDLYLVTITGGQQVQLVGHTTQVRTVAVSPDGKRALSGTAGGAKLPDGQIEDLAVLLWDLDTGKQIGRFAGHTNSVTGVALSADAQRGLSGSMDLTTRLLDLSRLPEKDK
jgi:WD40 repeat protein